MYWPTSIAKSLALPPPLDSEPITHLRQSKKGNFFCTLTKSGLGVWDVRPTVLQAALVRTPESLERWGSNIDVCWAYDGRGIIVLTSTSHLLMYQLAPTSKPSYDHPPTAAFPLSGGAGEGDALMGWTLRSLGVAFIMGGCESLSAQHHSLACTLRHPPSVLTVPYPIPAPLLSEPGSHFPPPPLDGDGEEQAECDVWDLEEARAWLGEGKPPVPSSWTTSRVPGVVAGKEGRSARTRNMHVMHTDDGSVWAVQNVQRRPSTQSPTDALSPDTLPPERRGSTTAKLHGTKLYPLSLSGSMSALGLSDSVTDKATLSVLNPKFGLIAIGTQGGLVDIITVPGPARRSHSLDLKHSANLHTSPGGVTSLAWTSDGYALAVGYEHGWAVWSMGGRLNGWGMALAGDERTSEAFTEGVVDLFWAPGNLELVVLANPPNQLYSIPFVKSATTGHHSPDNTRYAFLQMDDRVLIYRGADQPDMSVINPESDVWQQVKIPSVFMSTNWPVRYASISSDGQLVAVAGRRGLTHWSSASGKWKLFGDVRQEQDFTVRGGLLWFHHVLVVAVEVDKTYQIRLYSRDQELDDAKILHSHFLLSPVLVMSLLDNSLLVYTADNTLHHFLIIPTRDAIRLHVCGSISFAGIVPVPARVRALSWLVPQAQKRLGDPADDLIVATIIFLVDGKLVLLRPRRAGSDEVRYDMQVLADRIESYWTHLHGVGTLENSLWGYDGQRMRVWLDALTVEHTRVVGEVGDEAYESVGESIAIRLDFYPLSILMDKGIIIGVDYETSSRALPFSMFKLQTSTHLFLPQFMRYHLASTGLAHALAFAANYARIVYFAHSLEMLLHAVLEDQDLLVDRTPHTGKHVAEDGGDEGGKDADVLPNGNSGEPSQAEPPLPAVIEFLDHFPESLDVVVGCARKTEVERWNVLFDAVGDPRELYEACLAKGALRTAAGYLLVLHTREELGGAGAGAGAGMGEMMPEEGTAPGLGDGTARASASASESVVQDTARLIRLAMDKGEYRLCKELLRFLHSVDETGAALRRATADLGLGMGADAEADPEAGGKTSAFGENRAEIEVKIDVVDSDAAVAPAQAHAPAPSADMARTASGASTSTTISASGSDTSDAAARARAMQAQHKQIGRISSPFQLESPRLIFSPPSPRTVGPGDAGRVPDALEVPTP